MSTVKVEINGTAVEVPKGTRILDAAKKVGVKIPALCVHPDLEPWAACGLCIVKVEGSPKLPRACATEVVDGAKYITHDPELNEVRRTTVEMMLANHPNECLTCGRSGTCELQTMAANFGIREIPFDSRIPEIARDESTPSLVLDPRKCISCGRCVLVCQQMQDVWALEFLNRGDETRMMPSGGALLNESPCIKCGQCSAHCPVGAIYEKDETKRLLEAIRDPDKHVAVQIAPAVRVALGEAFDLPAGEITTGKIYAALRRLGVDAVFDTNFAADLTIMEEGTELVERLTKGNGEIPLITSCCPSWVDYMEKYYDDMIPHFSTAKSPMMMQGVLTKTYYAESKGLSSKEIFSAAIMPCTAKKFECSRDVNMFASGEQDVDVSLTTRELARMIKSSGIDFHSLSDEDADAPIGAYTGAGTIFGATGGVMEAALRTAHYLVTGNEHAGITFEDVRGMDGVRSAEVQVGDTTLRVAIAHGIANVRDLMNQLREAKAAGQEPPFHFIEVMACRGGCISGGGQPYATSSDETREQRIAGIYKDDEKSEFRCSHHNPFIKKVYDDFLGAPNGKKAHELLHTHYTPRPLYKK
ncbi:NADH-quinone oxidoreductase subunit G [Alkalispirochaeta americana]|uniref:NADH-quinone oxidoreductase subunit G n=1 Tax=Alkalispirochaeta americana TaxID=159291 RepID=A0A1N6WBR8_9SPIO|nr:NADH-dependent [FeFe] hydrogenase, group A6 [Alkalispirochaeta americana]SIQ87478.1 NADH-quinone oxidoreductase subunit G [Alkalispirochaeta americana]